jgi:uncharacterized protein
MNKHLEQLIELSHVDKEINDFEPRIAQANRKYDEIVASKDVLLSEVEVLESEAKHEQLKKQKNELHLAELSAKLQDNSKKSSAIKTEREMKSLQLEEEIAKEQVTFANEEIARLEKVIANKIEKISSLKEKIAEFDNSLASVKDEVQSSLTEIEAARKKVFEKKEKIVSGMNQKGLSFYQKIRRWAKDTTAVPVRNQACMGCYMVINDKIYSDVIRGEEITTCPHCGRILYIEAGVAQEA